MILHNIVILVRVEMPEIAGLVGDTDDQILAVHDALERFTAQDPQKAEWVKLRYFVGVALEEVAEVLGISVGTAKRHWAYARAWLAEEILQLRNIIGRMADAAPQLQHRFPMFAMQTAQAGDLSTNAGLFNDERVA